MSILELKNFLSDALKRFNISSDIHLIEFMIRNNNKLSLILTFIRSGLIGKSKIIENEKFKLLLDIFSFRIIEDDNLSIGNLNKLSLKNDKMNHLKIVGPVCPDYSYEYTDKGRYRYTFQSVGSGIGLVAKKAIDNFKRIKEISNDLINNGLNLEFEILVGDFEASEENLTALKEKKTNFLSKIKSSCINIQEESSIKAYPFTDLCQGLDGWNYQISQLKNIHKVNNFNDLKYIFPKINHDKKLISRIPLYKKWFGKDKNYKEIFFNQSLEYMLMGNIIYSNFFGEVFLLASDHKAMRDYYSLISNIDIISSSTSY
ncbi:hypothetical protein EW14_1508 [Prochlorococcus sp. MIT 0604]|nr:hypothetical protein EW14_1508 [Prochlorococcus sp. MIT 0604]